ncbi:alpha/beta hydrolase [Dongia deserti]|uniref:alpha/beta hydrolase n=1 Tax=Dongia deserti TaxID=2268030 RepID=UPI000E65AFCC|nr:alpha/beta hydrolase [Dongia deserti]
MLGRLATILLVPLLLAACAPRLQEIGPPVDQPRIVENDGHEAALHMPDDVDLPLRVWYPWDRPAEAVILALHGFNDYSRGFAAPGKGMARRGFIFYAYDQRGFGRAPQRGIWAGEQQMMDDLRVAARLIKARHPDLPLFLLGESMGGAVIMNAAVSDDPPIADGLILAAPAIWGWQTLSPLARTVTETAAHIIPWVTVVPTGFHGLASNNRAALRELARDPLVIKETRIDTALGLVNLMTDAFNAASKLDTPRWLVLFGKHEAILDRGAVNEALPHFRELPPEQGRVAIYPQGYHLLLRDFNQYAVYDDMAAWIRDPAAPLPSGADESGAAKSIN